MRPLLLLLFLAVLGAEAYAHGRRASSSDITGLAIPSMSHGALLVLEDHFGAILALSDRAKESDPVFRKLKNYTRIQNYYCLWGMAPRAVADEESPFNECSHAYLSGARMLLLHMRDMPSVSTPAGELVSRIDAEMVERGSALVQCAYSDEPFYTGDFITPHWENVAGHRPTLFAALSPVLAVLGLVAGRRVIRR
ncbi:MAG: hypothetical protein WA980_01060 [Shinella zoogloeoides]|uniref:hypothetical protein n=1 Tax=Shinella zoogloeoides TaxID=352475 RepID=UPI003C7678CF